MGCLIYQACDWIMEVVAMLLWEILVPTQFDDTKEAVAAEHHREWDCFVREVSGGLTMLRAATGQWVHSGKVQQENVIPVRLIATRAQMEEIAKFTASHYRQKVIMAYKISDEVLFVTATGPMKLNG
jgi:hypothetical protein